jgi:hypothetical protein
MVCTSVRGLEEIGLRLSNAIGAWPFLISNDPIAFLHAIFHCLSFDLSFEAIPLARRKVRQSVAVVYSHVGATMPLPRGSIQLT